MVIIIDHWYIGVILLIIILKCSEMKTNLLEEIPLNHERLQVTAELLVVSHYSRRNYKTLLRLCGYIDALNQDADAQGNCGWWSTYFFKRVS